MTKPDSEVAKEMADQYCTGFHPVLHSVISTRFQAGWSACLEHSPKVKALVEALQFYADGGEDLEPKPEKAHLYDKDYPMDSTQWRMRSMSDYRTGKRAREALALFEKEGE